MEIRAQVPDKYLSLIRSALSKGTLIKASAQNFQENVELQLLRLSGQANTSNGGVDALFKPASKNHTLVLNKALEIRIDMPALENVVVLPISAIYGTQRIYRVEEGRLQSVNVSILGKQLSTPSPNDYQENSTRLDKVIISSELLKDGDKITITQLPNAISGLKIRERN